MKNILLTIALLMALMVQSVQGQYALTSVVADGTSTTRYLPAIQAYGQEVCQSLYPASEIIEFGYGDTITKLHFYVASGSWNSVLAYEVRMANTTATSLAGSFDTTASTLVYTGTLTANTTAGMDILLDTPFVYEGGNLLVDVSTTNTGYSGTAYFYAKPMTGGGRMRNGSSARSEGTVVNFLPKCEFTFLPYSESCPRPRYNISISDITSASAVIDWRASGASRWNIQYRANGDTGWTSINGVTPRYKLRGLQPNTVYYFRIQADCGSDVSTWTNGISFRTLNNGADIVSFTPTAEVITPTVFDAVHRTVTAVVRYNTDLTNLSYTVQLSEHATAYLNGSQFPSTGTADFTNPLTVRVVPEDSTTAVNWTIAVAHEECATPYNLKAKNVSRRTADLEWNVSDLTATTFDVVIDTVAHTDSTLTTAQSITVSNVNGLCTYPLAGLTRGTHYYTYVRTNCGTTVGQWRSVEFTTLTPPYSTHETVSSGSSYNYNIPFSCQEYDGKFTKSQFIYPSSMLTALRGKTLNRMTFFSAYYSYYSALGGIIEVRIGLTNSDSIDTAYEPSPSTVVYRGPVTGCDYKWEFYFWANTFAYPAGGGNLLVEMNVLSSGGRKNDVFYGTTGNATGCSRYTENGTESTLDFLPKVQFDYCEAMITCPEVTGITATNIGSSTADIRWTESTGDFAGASELFYSLTQVADSSITNPQYTNINGTTQTLSGLAPDTVYYVYVRTHCNAEGNDDGWSNWAEGRFRTEMTCTYPRNVVASVTDKSTIHIQWTDKTGASTAGDTYEVYYSTTQAEPTTAGTTTTLGYFDATGLIADTTYYCYVRKACGGTMGYSPWIECQATTPAAMPAVLNLTASDISYNAFRATWNRDNAHFANETQWEYACVATGSTPAAWNTITDSTLDARQCVSTIISGIAESTTYDLYVRPTDGTNRGAAAMITVTTTANSAGCNYLIDTSTYNATTYVPAYSNNGSTYSLSIYTARELRARGFVAGTITAIGYLQKSCGDTATANKYQKMTTVWMGNKTDTAFDYHNWISGLTLVKSAGIVNFNKVNDLVSIPLDSGFEWDGISSIVVGVLLNTTGSSTTMSFDNAKTTAADFFSENYKELYGTSNNQITVNNGVPSVTNGRIYHRPNIHLCYAPSVSCPKPTNLAVDNITATSARASWYPGGTESSWNYYVSTTAMTDSALNATATTATTSMANVINGLSSDTEYYLYVRSNCTIDSSAWKVKQFRTLIACSDPINAVAVNSAANQVTFDAAAGTYGTVGTYDFRYWADGSTDTTTVAGQTSQLTVDSLPDGVTYHWQVRANCTCGDSSGWVTGNDVSVCCVFNVDSTHAFTEGFENPGFVSGCWTNQHVAGSGTDLWWRSTSDKHSGTSSATLFNLSSGDRTNLVTPKLNIPTANAYEVSFWMNRSAQVRSNEGVKVWVNTQNNTTGGTELMYISRYYAQAPTESGAGWYKYSATIPTSGDVYIVFEGIENGGAFLRIDDISVNLGTTAYTLSTSVAPSAAMGRVEVSANATDTTTDGRFKCLTTPTLRALANPGYQFSGWSNGQTVGTIKVCVTKDTTLVAQFEALPYNLNVVAAPGSEDHGTVAGGGYYKHSTVHQITATPDPHYRVVWQDGDTSTSRTIIMPAADTTFIATFVGDSFTIAATCDASMGSVTGAGRYAYGDSVTLTAVPAPHHHFFNWSNGTTTNPLTFVVTKDESFRANFTAESYTVTVNVNDSTAGTVTGAGTYGYGSTVTLIAHPAEGYKLDEWRMGTDGAYSVSQDTLSFIIISDTTVEAVFTLAPVSVEHAEAESYIAYSNGLSIVITGAENSTIAVYDITGKLVKMVKSAGANECVNVYAAGVYIIRIDNRKTLRVVVK